jgi:hypothetical protein
MFPMGAPLPAAPPCIRHRRFPRTAGDGHGFPLRVRVPQRGARFMGSFSRSISCSPLFDCSHPRRDGTYNCLSTVIDIDVLDGDVLPTLTAVSVEGLGQSRACAGEFVRLVQVLVRTFIMGESPCVGLILCFFHPPPRGLL